MLSRLRVALCVGVVGRGIARVLAVALIRGVALAQRREPFGGQHQAQDVGEVAADQRGHLVVIAAALARELGGLRVAGAPGEVLE